MQPLRARVDPGVMAMKGYPTFPKAGASPSDGLMTCFGPLWWGEFYPFAEMQSKYSAGPVDWVVLLLVS